MAINCCCILGGPYYPSLPYVADLEGGAGHVALPFGPKFNSLFCITRPINRYFENVL